MITKYLNTVFVLVILTLVNWPSCVSAGKKLLAVSSANGLKYTSNDAKLIAAAFGRYLDFDRSDIEIIDINSSTKNNIIKELTELASTAKAGDLVIIFFAGHGIIIDKEYFFVPLYDRDKFGYFNKIKKNKDLDTARKIFLSDHEIVVSINKIPTKNKLLIVDSCHSGAIAKFNSDVAQFTVIAATQAGDISHEVRKIGNGVLTHYFVKLLKNTAWNEEEVFDSMQLTEQLIKMTEDGGWKQKAVHAGGEYFSSTIEVDKKWALPSF